MRQRRLSRISLRMRRCGVGLRENNDTLPLASPDTYFFFLADLGLAVADFFTGFLAADLLATCFFAVAVGLF